MEEIKNKIEDLFGSIVDDLKIFTEKYGAWVVIGLIVFYLWKKLDKK